ADIKNKPFIVFHDAYHYFEDSFGLTIAGSLSVSPDRPVSAQRLHEIRTILQSTKTLCIFSEPQFESGLVDTLTRGSTVKKGTLDPIGSDAPMGEEGWFVLMDHLVTNLVRCLGQPPA
ncbi:MAG TPA: zinc ABC transporter solute-binding protein, partial [Magnetococcales bacterium]|nr:zinc ABC transporter solute-binding protein [Magnetococcales bacterium]